LDGIVHLLDKYSVCGERKFLSFEKTDNRYDNILKGRKIQEHYLALNENRQNINGKDYNKYNHEKPANFVRTINDFAYNDALNYNNADYAPRESYTITFTDGTQETLSGRVVKEDKIDDISAVNPGDEITYYQNDNEVFEQIWQIYQPNLAEDIPHYSAIWKEALVQLNKHYQPLNLLFENLQIYKWNTSLITLKGLLKEQNDTDFPKVSSLTAIKNLCQTTIQMENHDIVTQFQRVLQAKRSNELRKGLGYKLSSALLDQACGIKNEDPDIVRLKEGRDELFNSAFEICIKSGTVQDIRKR
jgi:hypothetical protein